MAVQLMVPYSRSRESWEADEFEDEPRHTLRLLPNHEVPCPLNGSRLGVRDERRDLRQLFGTPEAVFPPHDERRCADSLQLRSELATVLARVLDQRREDARVEARFPSAPLVLPVSTLNVLFGHGRVDREQGLGSLLNAGIRVRVHWVWRGAVAKLALVWAAGSSKTSRVTRSG